MIRVKVTSKSNHSLPEYKTEGAAGMDMYAHLPNGAVIIAPMERKLIPTGISIALPKGYEAQIRPRSGLALKHGITILNTPGTIDSDYRGEIANLLINLGSEPFVVNDGDRIAQMVIHSCEQIEWEPVMELPTSVRGEGGYGSTGV